MNRHFEVQAGSSLRGRLRVPGDKSISHRSIMLGSIAEGTTHVSGFLEGADALSTMNVFRALGVRIEGPDAGRVVIHGVGQHGLKPPTAPLDCGNAGTAMRLLIGLLSGQRFACTLIGDESLSKRPMRRVADPLGRMGARIHTQEGRPPVRIEPAEGALHGIDYAMPMASAQVKSSLLLAALNAQGETSVTEPAPTRDHTERMLEGFGVKLSRSGATVRIRGGQSLRATDIDVPADISSAAFFLVGASIAQGADLVLEHVGVNPTRTGILDILKLMGANIERTNERLVGGEPVADLRVRSAELRVKESDRIAVMADGLRALGIDARPTADGMIIEGRGGMPGPVFGSGTVASHGDHRIAMAFAMAALRARGSLRIEDTLNVGTSFPGFVELCAGAGLGIIEAQG